MTSLNHKKCVLYIVRHGTTSWNEKKLMQGHTDIPLSEKGEQEAKHLGSTFREIKFTAVFASDLERARQTAAFASTSHNLPVQTRFSLRERHSPLWEGKSFTDLRVEFRARFEEMDRLPRHELLDFRFSPGDENYAEVCHRVLTTLKEIASNNLGGTVLVVTHGGVIHALLLYLNTKWGEILNTSYFRMVSDGDSIHIEEGQEGITTSHLQEAHAKC